MEEKEGARMSTGSPKGPSAPDAVRQTIRLLKEAKVALDRLDNHFSAQIPEIESLLTSLKLGVPLSVAVDADGSGWSQSLEFRKLNGHWRLMVVDEDATDDIESRPLIDCDRETRIEAMKHLPALLGSAIEQMNEMIETRTGLIDTVGRFMEVLREEAKFVDSHAEAAAGGKAGSPSPSKKVKSSSRDDEDVPVTTIKLGPSDDVIYDFEPPPRKGGGK